MKLLLIIAFIFAYVCFIPVRLIVKHPFATVYYAIRDLYEYFKYHKYDECKTGELIGFIGLFGKGKTLSAVHHVITKYNRYNDKIIYDKHRKKYVKQKIKVYSNVNLTSIPYTPFTGLQQMIDVAAQNRELDEINNTLTCSLFLGDEFSVQMNSRQFKTNIDPLFLNTILTCRHHRISLFFTAQRFGHVDALLRQVTSAVVSCNKIWRFMCHDYFDAWDMENAQSPTMIQPYLRTGFFVFDSDYDAYDTLACVDNLSKDVKEGRMLSSEEILAAQGNVQVNMESVASPSKKYIKNQRKMKK